MNKNFKVSKAGLDLIKLFESFRSKPYLCPAGIPTIGYGTTRYPNGKRVELTDPYISEVVATNYLMHDVRFFEESIKTFVMSNLNQNQYDALVSFVYNIGPTNFKNSTILKLINANPDNPLINQQFLRWNRAKGKILPGLTKRRKAESELYFS